MTCELKIVYNNLIPVARGALWEPRKGKARATGRRKAEGPPNGVSTKARLSGQVLFVRPFAADGKEEV